MILSATCKFGPRCWPTLHAAAHWFPDAAFQRVPVSPPAVSGLGGEVYYSAHIYLYTSDLGNFSVWHRKMVCFCISGAQKSVPAAKLCILHCTLPFPAQSAGRCWSRRKRQTKKKSWPDAAGSSHHVPWRLGSQKYITTRVWIFRCDYPSVTSGNKMISIN